MIELNLTYEESKKILELGYDFSFICKDFELRPEPEGDVRKYVSLWNFEDGDVELYDTSGCDTDIYNPKDWGIIPIVPKAALEKCLQSLKIKDVNITKADWDYVCITTKKWEPSSLTEKHSVTITSPYRAFIWVHENYPEELRKTFEEVMK